MSFPLIAEVIVPVPVKTNFHYVVPETQREFIAAGKRVLVPFGRSKIYTGVVRRVLEHPPQGTNLQRLKPLEDILDDRPIFQEAQLALFEWMAFYYVCTPGEVLKAALPVGLSPESALRVSQAEGIDPEQYELSGREFDLMEMLRVQPELTFKDIATLWGIRNPNPHLKAMQERGLIRLYQQVEEKYKPKFKKFLRLSQHCTTEEALQVAFEALEKAPSQENLFMRIVSEYYHGRTVPKSETLKELELGSQVATALIKKGLIEEEKVQVDRLELYGYDEKPVEIQLTNQQQRVRNEIEAAFEASPRKPVLLHGITGSGKTHLYMEFIEEALARKEQVLYLLPEITLTKQIIDRLKSAFGEQVGVYHSRFNEQERVEIWQKVRKGDYQVVIGVRSATFLPFTNLGLIVVDEEHDRSFKQYEPAPRYNARDVAVYYAHKLDIPIILGSATPSFESYLNAQKGKYQLVELHERAVAATMPRIELVDMREAKKKRLVNGLLSNQLQTAITEALEREEQIIIFQNRRGYAPYLICENCGAVPQCINCDISLTYHKEKDHLRCHYCGYTDLTTDQCKQCGHVSLRRGGVGTEKIAEFIKEVFPTHRVERMDLDTTRNKMGYRHLITRFEQHDIDILVGTQMVSKGLDFENVTLVGVIQADPLLSFPDFRAYEHAYQLLTQVSGRAGRSKKQGKVIIQSFQPDNVVLTSIAQPFGNFFRLELPSRKEIGYPPYTRLMRIELRHQDRQFIEIESFRLERLLRPHFSSNLLGPDYALVARLRNQYRMQFLVKLSKQFPLQKLRDLIHRLIDQYYQQAPNKTLRIVVDVDPM